MTNKNFTSSLEGIGHILRDRPLQVPPFQRSFSWKREEVQAFWDDLIEAQIGNRDSYFLGTIVLTQGDQDKTLIVDGQQRLATTTMLLAAIRNCFLEEGDENRASVIERQYVSYTSLKSGQSESRLTLNEDDCDFFYKLVVSRPTTQVPSSTSQSNQRIADAFRLVGELLANQVKTAGRHWAETLMAWADFIEDRARVIVLNVPTESDAFVIFETLNDRGMDLTVVDLLKNHLFSLGKSNLAEIKDSWNNAIDELGEEDERTAVSFLRHYWSSVNGATRERELYSNLRENVRSGRQALELASSLSGAAPYYAALLNPEHDAWLRAGAGGHSLARQIELLGIEQNRPLLLAALENLEGPALAHLIRAVICWSVRGLVVGGIGGGVTEKRYAEAAVRVRKTSASSVRDVYGALETIVPSDDEFVAAFELYRPPRVTLARHLLLELEKSLRSDEGMPALTNVVEREAIVIRMLPAAGQRRIFPAFAQGDIRQWSRRLGNLMLITKETSPEELDSWDKIQKVLLASPFVSTRLASKMKDWSPESISNRQKLLAAISTRIWPRLPKD